MSDNIERIKAGIKTAAEAEVILAAWRERAASILKYSDPLGTLKLEDIYGKTGQELYEALLSGDLPGPPLARTLDFHLIEADVGRVVFQGNPQSIHYNPMGTVHGGWIAALLDSALGSSVHTSLPAGRAQTTVELKINYVKALTDKVPLVRAEATAIHVGRSIGTADGRLFGPDGTLYAHGSTTCFIYDLPTPKS